VSPLKLAPFTPQVPRLILSPGASAMTLFIVFCCALFVLVALKA